MSDLLAISITAAWPHFGTPPFSPHPGSSAQATSPTHRSFPNIEGTRRIVFPLLPASHNLQSHPSALSPRPARTDHHTRRRQEDSHALHRGLSGPLVPWHLAACHH